jgi:hypothetical protein
LTSCNSFVSKDKDIVVSFEIDNVAGLANDNLVLANGMRVGRVKDIRLKSDYSGQLEVFLRLYNPSVKIPKNAVAVITDTDMMGTKAVRFSYDEPCTEGCLADGDRVKAAIGSYFDDEMLELNPLLQKAENTYSTLDTMLKLWRTKRFGDDNSKLRQAEKDIKEMMANFDEATVAGKKLAINSSQKVTLIQQHSQAVLQNFEGQELEEIAKNTATFQANLKATNFEKLSQQLTEVLEKIKITEKSISQTQQILAAIIQKIKQKENGGTVAKFLNDPRFQSDNNNKNNDLDVAKLLEDIRLYPERYTFLLKK